MPAMVLYLKETLTRCHVNDFRTKSIFTGIALCLKKNKEEFVKESALLMTQKEQHCFLLV